MFRLNSLVLAACGLLLLAFPPNVRAEGLSVVVEPAAAIPLTQPQADIYDVGGGQTVKAFYGLTPYIDVGPSLSFLFLPSPMEGAEAGVAWGFGGGVRLKRPHDATSYGGVSPWVGVDALYVRTGDLDRPGFDAALGLSVPLTSSRAYWAGPFVRYVHVMQGESAGFDNRDAKVLTLGVSFEVGPRMKQQPLVAVAVEPTIKVVEVIREVEVIVPKEVVVTEPVAYCADAEKLELKEKLYFQWDRSTLDEASYPVLDKVVVAMKANPRYRVEVEGHADSSGGEDHNQALSEQRAQAVLDYLASNGVAQDRLMSKGFSSSEPTRDNGTKLGRKANRRVEFVVHFIIVGEGGGK